MVHQHYTLGRSLSLYSILDDSIQLEQFDNRRRLASTCKKLKKPDSVMAFLCIKLKRNYNVSFVPFLRCKCFLGKELIVLLILVKNGSLARMLLNI